jgi:hypothetical protein
MQVHNGHCAGGGIQQTIKIRAVTAQQQAQFEIKLAKFFFTTLTPLNRLASPELKAALAVLGATPPERTYASSQLLDDAYNLAFHKVISSVGQSPFVCITMDGWKKRTCENGASLITVVMLLPDGSSHFWKVCRRAHLKDSFMR